MCADFHSELAPDQNEQHPADVEDYFDYQTQQREAQDEARRYLPDEDEHTRNLYARGQL